jgi:tetratricopeptide (TPR) repeat protein
VLIEHVCKSYDPDVVIVYSGNNEFLEIHAEKYASANATALTRFRDVVVQTNLYRLVDRAVRGAPKAPSMADEDFSEDDLRMTQAEVIEDIEMDADEISEIVGGYGDTIGRVAAAAGATKTPLVLMTVASNWEWRGREDLPEDWLDEYVPAGASSAADRYRQVLELLATKIDEAEAEERWELHFARAVAAQGLGDFELARREYRRAMNVDPHLRRALDDMADEVRRVAREHKTSLLDVIEVLGASTEHGIVGHDEFYDYVHFTPRGNALVAAELYRALESMGALEGARPLVVEEYLEERLAEIDSLDADPVAIDEWMGVGFDLSRVADRDLWKYDRLLEELDARAEANPADGLALAFRGNYLAFQKDGRAPARRDYEAALRLPGEIPGLRENLERLTAEHGAL